MVAIKLLEKDIPVPAYQTKFSAGMDLHSRINTILNPGKAMLIPCGFQMAIPNGYEAQIRPRSGLALKYGITVLNSPGTIDSDYRGEVGAILINHGPEPFVIKRLDRIAQMIIAAVKHIDWEVVEELTHTERGEGAFGSTGK